MNLLPSKVGAEPKKIAMLGGLLVVLVAVWLLNRSPSSPDAPTALPVTAPKSLPDLPAAVGPRTVPVRAAIPGQGPRVAQRNAGGSGIDDFKPTLKLKEGTDISKIDPSLRTDLIAKLHTLELTGGARSLFEFAQPPVPPPPPVEKINVFRKYGPEAPPPIPVPAKIPPPPPPPIPLKYYGYSGTVRANGLRQAFFLEGEEIYVAAENDTVKNRYKIVRIGVNSAVVEDTTNKNQQTLPLTEEGQ
jgi:hypothetical protein